MSTAPIQMGAATFMANFTTHIAVGTVVSGALATLTLAADVIPPDALVAVTLAGVLGSVLPDIDLDHSRPSRAFFSGLAVFLSFAVLFSVASRYSIVEMWAVWLGTLLLVRYGLQALFDRFSYHRGIWHSLLAGIFFALLTVLAFNYVLGFHEGIAWLAGGFTFLGVLTHLLLDEIYSIDVMDTHVKRSFGSALKLFDGRRPGESVLMAAATALIFFATPPSSAFFDGLTSRQLWTGLQQRLLPPDNNWFGISDNLRRLAGPRQETSGIATGSLPSAAPKQ